MIRYELGPVGLCAGIRKEAAGAVLVLILRAGAFQWALARGPRPVLDLPGAGVAWRSESWQE